jgi:HSP90 family molecular chaperone
MADSQSLMEEWVRVLQNVVQRNALKLLLSREDLKPTLQVSRIVGGLKAAFCL